LAAAQVNPFLGAIVLQKLGPKQIKDWHNELLASGGKDGAPLSAMTVRHAHRLLNAALNGAIEVELISGNFASLVSPPTVDDDRDVASLTEDQINLVEWA
jgi:hypothetical protein